VVNAYTLIENSLGFFSLVDCRLAAQIANVGQKNHIAPVDRDEDKKLDGSFIRFYIPTDSLQFLSVTERSLLPMAAVSFLGLVYELLIVGPRRYAFHG
jgi:hypothetical protein